MVTASCNERIDVKFRTVYKKTTANQVSVKKNLLKTKNTNGSFTRFGSFMGTITPTKVTATFMMLKFQDSDSDAWPGTSVELIDNHVPIEDPQRFADFTNNSSVELKPVMYGNISSDGWFVEKDVVLKYLGIFPRTFVFEFLLPEQYNEVEILNDHKDYERYPESEGFGFPTGFNDFTTRNGDTLTCISQFFLQHEYLGASNAPNAFVFGGTDSCYVVNANNLPAWEKCSLVTNTGSKNVARSGNYSTPTLAPPIPGTTKLITTTISFDSNDIIEVYTGKDNLPYTFDDIFTFPPKFWERFKVEITQN